MLHVHQLKNVLFAVKEPLSLFLSLSATVVDDQHELQSIGNLSLPGLAKLLLHRRLGAGDDPAHPASSRGGRIFSCFNCQQLLYLLYEPGPGYR